MNISSENASIPESNPSHYFPYFNFTKVETSFDSFSVAYIFSFLLSFPPNSYVIWLILTGTGNGLVAEFFILNLSVCEILLSLDVVVLFLFNYYYLYILYYFWHNFRIVRMLVDIFNEIAVCCRPLFESLICVERYLAVVHPVTFLKFKPLRYRLMCSAGTWLAAFGVSVGNILILWFASEFYIIFLIVPLLIILIIQLFCCVSVLRALKQSGPGERGREREEENSMKKRAFYLILITTVSMIITYVPVVISLLSTVNVPENTNTIRSFGFVCFAVVGLVQPFLFLYRVGKLPFINNSNNSA